MSFFEPHDEYRMQLARSLKLNAFMHSVDSYYGPLRWNVYSVNDKLYGTLINFLPPALKNDMDELIDKYQEPYV
jgi:hypothetical protein